jgi:hypothetical protein
MLLSITPKTLAHEIIRSSQRIYYSGAGIDEDVSDALLACKEQNPSVEIIVVIDCTAHARRLGYGNQDSIKKLQQKKIPVFQQQGVRLSFCVADRRGWVFCFPPQLVENIEPSDGFNCIELDAHQLNPLAKQIRALVEPDLQDDLFSENLSHHEELDVQHIQNPSSLEVQQIQVSASSEELMPMAEQASHCDTPISHLNDALFSDLSSSETHLRPFHFAKMAKKLTDEQIKQLDEELEQNPPQRFNVSQQVQVFNSRVEFVEVEFTGGYIDRHVFKFPDEIKKLISDDAEAQKRLSASYKLIDSTSKVSSKKISSEVDILRRNFLKPMGKLGRVMLRAQKQNFEIQFSELEKKIEVYKKELEESLGKELEKSRKALINALIDRVKSNPPDDLKFGIETSKVTKAQSQAYLERLLEKYMPKTEQLLGAIELKCHFKAVTYEMLCDEEFQKQLKSQFPHVQWVVPMEQYTAAKGEQVD